jgi:hypothetical protein
MARLVPRVGTNDGEDSPVGPVVRAMAASLIEQHEPLVSKQGSHLTETNIPRRGLHFAQKFFSSAHLQPPLLYT